MTATASADQQFLEAIARTAQEVAAEHAGSVDRDSRFPSETINALRESGALGAFVPPALGGQGVSLPALAQACYELARCCSASGLIFAMHQIEVLTIARHLLPGSWFEQYLSDVARDQRLIASITSEVGTGGDMGRSLAAVTTRENGSFSLDKQAPTVSYGAHADDYLTTARRAPEADESDQVLVLHTGDQTTMEKTGTWDTLGMRGTCSPGFTVHAEFSADQVLAAPFSQVMAESLVPLSHVLWSHVWLGIATEAFERGRGFVRAAARRTPGVPVPAAHELSRVMAELSMLRSEVARGLSDFQQRSESPDRRELATLASALRFNNLKLAASEQAPRICMSVLEVVGITAYKNDSPFGVGRQLRDSMSARLMVANERLNATDAGLLMIAKEV